MKDSTLLSQPLPHRLFQSVLTAACYVMLRPKVEWLDKADKKRLKGKPVIFVCNHTHHFDGVFVSSCMHSFHPFALVSRKWYDKKGMGTLIRLSRSIPIDLNSNDASWYLLGEKLLKDGGSMLIFPEGAVAREGKMLPFKPGAGLLSAKTGAVIVPTASYGYYKMPFGKRQRLLVGRPIESSCPGDMRFSLYSKELMKQAQEQVRSLYDTMESKHGRLDTYYEESYAGYIKTCNTI